MDATEARALFERELGLIDRLIASVCRRYGLEGDDADSFASCVRAKLIERDYRVLRKATDRGSLKTYLSVVVANCHRDHRIQESGKWRPSAVARRLGPEAVLLDAYLNRDGHPMEEAVQRVLFRDDTSLSERELRAVAARIPRRPRRTFSSLEAAEPAPAAGAPDTDLSETEDAAAREGMSDALAEALEQLPARNRLVFKLRFWDGLTVADIARSLGMDQMSLYRQIRADLRHLRETLETRGVEREDVVDLIGG